MIDGGMSSSWPAAPRKYSPPAARNHEEAKSVPVGVDDRVSFYDSSEGQIGIKVVLGAEERRVEVEVVVLERVHEARERAFAAHPG